MEDIAFNHRHYVPILKGKRGEFNALKELFPQDKAALTPLIEVPPIPWKRDKAGVPHRSRTPEAHLEYVWDGLVDAWGTSRSLFADLSISGLPELAPTAARHVVTYFFDGARSVNLKLIPVTGLAPTSAARTALAGVLAVDKRGLCVRLRRNQGLFDPTMGQQLVQLIASFGLKPEDVDLILDLEDIRPEEGAALAQLAGLRLSTLPALGSWRTLTLAGSTFPQGVGSSVTTGTMGVVPRGEWLVWRALRSNQPTVTRMPTFSDYGVSHPEPFDTYPWLINPSASIRYTTPHSWLLFKGKSFRDNGGGQYRSLASQVLAQPEYCGRVYSAGDEYIEDCAVQAVTTGNLEKWVYVGTNHHLTLVVRQLASLGAP